MTVCSTDLLRMLCKPTTLSFGTWHNFMFSHDTQEQKNPQLELNKYHVLAVNICSCRHKHGWNFPHISSTSSSEPVYWLVLFWRVYWLLSCCDLHFLYLSLSVCLLPSLMFLWFILPSVFSVVCWILVLFPACHFSLLSCCLAFGSFICENTTVCAHFYIKK